MGKARDKIKAGVTTIKKAATKVVRHIPDKIAKNKALNVFEATAAVHRESQSGGKFKASDKQREIFEQQQAKVAALRGIQKEGDAYKPEHLEKELSPKEILNYSMYQYYLLEENKDTAQQEIQARLASVYTDENNQQEVIPQEITATNNSLHDLTLHTDEDFFKLNEDEQEEYLGKLKEISGAEYDRLIKERDQRNTKAAHIYKDNDRGATPHTGTDSPIKSKRGDIIDFMMDEIIIASFDWTLNRAVNCGSYILLGVPYNIGQSLKDAHQRRKANDYVDDQVESGPKIDENAPMDASHYYEELENKNILYQNLLSEDAQRIYDVHCNMVGHLQNYNPTNSEELQEFKDTEVLNDHKLQIAFGELLFSSGITSDTIRSTEPYSKIYNLFDKPTELESEYGYLFEKETGPLKIEEGKILLRDGKPVDKEQIDQIAYSYDISTWLQETYKKRDASSEKDKSNIFSDNIPLGLQNLGLTSEILKDQFEKAQKQTLATLQIQRKISTDKSMSEIFANDYAQYMISEHSKDADNPKLTAKDVEKYRNQAKVIFWQNMKRLRGEKIEDAISIDTLMVAAEQMKKQSKDSKEKTPNLVKELIRDKNFDLNKTAQTAMTEFAQDLTVEQYIKIKTNNLNRVNGDIDHLKGEKVKIDKKRELIDSIKQRVNMTTTNKQSKRRKDLDDLKKTVQASGLDKKNIDFFNNQQTVH